MVSRVIAALLVVAALVGTGFVFHRALSDVARTPSERSLVDDVATVRGRTVTCAQLLPDVCSFDLQFAFDRWGEGLDGFVTSDLGPWGSGLPVPAAAELGLQACHLSSMPGQTYLEFERVVRVHRPEASVADLFPFWDRARRVLCPTG